MTEGPQSGRKLVLPIRFGTDPREGVLSHISIFPGVVVIGAVFLSPINPYARAVVWIILSAGALFLLMRWHALTFAYQCDKCGHA